MASSEVVSIAILGAGIFAREQHLPTVLATPQFKLKAVYSRSRASVDNFVSDVKKINGDVVVDGYYDVDENGNANAKGLDALLAREDIEAVDIALPILVQPEVIRKALKAGKHVLCEKPIAGTVDEAVKLYEYYLELKKTNPKLIFSIAENWRYEPAVQTAAEAVKKIGKLRFFSMHVYSDTVPSNKYYNTAWRKTPEYQGGFLLDGGVHYAAAFRLILGTPIDTVSAFSRLNKEYLLPIDTLHAIVKLSDGTTGTFGASFASGLPGRNVTVVGENGHIKLDVHNNSGYKLVTTIDGKTEEQIFKYEGVPREIAAYAAAVRAGQAEDYASALEAVYDVAFVEILINSSEKGGQPLKFLDLKHLAK